jgi:hypothetical protein
MHAEGASDLETKLYFQSKCRNAAEVVLEFTRSLQHGDLGAFWLPCKLSTSHVTHYAMPSFGVLLL